MSWLIIFDYQDRVEQSISRPFDLLFFKVAFYKRGLFYAIEKIPDYYFKWYTLVLLLGVSYCNVGFYDVNYEVRTSL